MRLPRTDADRSERFPRFPPRQSLTGFLQRLDFRLVLALAFVSLIALTVSGLAITQILPDYFRRQAEERLESAAISIAVIAQEITDREREVRPGAILAPELRPIVVFRPAARVAAGPLVPASVTILNEAGQTLASAEPPDVTEFESQGLRLDPAVETYRTGLIALYLDEDRQLAVPYEIVLFDAYTSREATLGQIRGTLATSGVLALLGSFVVGALVAARFAEPISALRRVAGRVAQGNLDERASPSGILEVDELGQQFNVMADRLSGTLRMLEADRDQLREFIADVSHELRTPIAALRLYTELQRDGRVDEAERAEFLDRSTEQIRRLEWMSTNLLDLSRIDAGIFPLDVRDGDLRDPIQSVVQAHAEVAEQRGIALGSAVPSVPVEMRFDRERVVQLLTNLVGNALKFTEPGGDVELRLTESSQDVTIEVLDSGPGIPPEELPRIFERFYRGTNTGQARASGSGLGLAIVRSIVEMHGGEIDVASVVGEGTEFRIRLPRSLQPADRQPADEAAAAARTEEKG